MSTPPGGPHGGPNVPPPPGQGGQPYGQGGPPGPQYGQGQPGQDGQQGQQGPGSGQQYGQGQPGQPYGQPGGYGGSQASAGPPPKKGMSKGLIGGIVGGVLLLLLLVCGGGALLLASGDDEEDPTRTASSSSSSGSSSDTSSSSEPTTTDTSSSEPTTETSSTSAGGDFSFPQDFDGWSKTDYTASGSQAGQSVAAYTKGSDSMSVVVVDAGDGVSADQFTSLWTKTEDIGDATCGEYTQAIQCATEEDGRVYLITTVGGTDKKTTAGWLGDFLSAV